MYVGAERMVFGKWFQKKEQHKRKSECHYKLFLNQGTTKGLKDEERKEREFNLLESKRSTRSMVHKEK